MNIRTHNIQVITNFMTGCWKVIAIASAYIHPKKKQNHENIETSYMQKSTEHRHTG